MRLLYIALAEPSWVHLTLRLDALGCTAPSFRWVSSAAEALTILRESHFDCLLIRHNPAGLGAESAHDAVDLLRAFRAGGCDDPVVVVATRIEDETWASVCGEEGELLVTSQALDSPALVPVILRAIQRVELRRENHRLAMADRRRLSRERDEAAHLLNQQRRILLELELAAAPREMQASGGDSSPAGRCGPAFAEPLPRFAFPESINEHYQELLRTYVIMGSGNLGTEIAKLAELLCLAALTPRQALELHLERVEQLVRGLGNRSTRHVMARADLMALELMMHLGECYQRDGRAA